MKTVRTRGTTKGLVQERNKSEKNMKEKINERPDKLSKGLILHKED